MSDLIRKFDDFIEDAYYSNHTASLRAAKEYCATGDENRLGAISSLKHTWYLGHLASFFPKHAVDGEGRRLLEAVLRLGMFEPFGNWYNERCAREGEDHALLTELIQKAGLSDELTLVLLAENIPLLDGDRITDAGRQVLAMKDRHLKEWILAVRNSEARASLTTLLLLDSKERTGKLSTVLLRCSSPELVAERLLEADKEHFRREVEKLARKRAKSSDRIRLLEQLRNSFAGEFDAQLREEVRKALRRDGHLDEELLFPGIELFAAELIEELQDLLERHKEHIARGRWDTESWIRQTASLIQVIGRSAGPAARPLLLGYVQDAAAPIAQAAVRGLIQIGQEQDHSACIAGLHALLKAANGSSIRKTVEIIEECEFGDFTEELWKHTGHKSKPVREFLVRYLQQRKDARARAVKLLAGRKVALRMSGVQILLGLGADQDLALLENHADDEASDEVRDAILLGLQSYWKEQGRVLGREDIAKNVKRCGDKLQQSPARWLELENLPDLYDRDGSALSREELAYLIYRQSRCKEMRADIEAQPLFSLIARASSGDFALHVFERFVASGADAGDRWALALAGLLGDDRVVPRFRRQIDEWASSGRGKLAEYATSGLALLGSNVALLTTDAIAIRYRSKFKNVGKAASAALDAAAAMHGIDRDELGDRIVPWLVFEPGQPKIYEGGGRRLELRIGQDFKALLWDLDKNKKAANLPKAASEDDKAEFKEFKATLRDVAKNQLLRVESLLVKQRRWDRGRWQGLFLEHPLLRPFAVGLVWGRYDTSGLLGCFRVLEDGALTDHEDDEPKLGPGEHIGIVHPLELSAELLSAWNEHLNDHEVEPPFPQLTRRAIRVKDADRERRSIQTFEGKELNAMTFRGRAERLGWARGSVVDAGGVNSYWSSYPSAGVDVFLMLEDFWVGQDIEDSCKLSTVYFVQHGSVAVGSYLYDEPSSEADERVIALGDVPPIVYSETIAQLEHIAGMPGGESA
jgi:hypothetical protein